MQDLFDKPARGDAFVFFGGGEDPVEAALVVETADELGVDEREPTVLLLARLDAGWTPNAAAPS